MNSDNGIQTIRVLHIEDNSDDQRFVLAALSDYAEWRFDLVQVGRLAEAKQLLDVEQFDVILLDLNLPDADSYMTFSGVLRHARTSAIVLLTGHLDDLQIIRFIRLGADDAVVKGSFNAEALPRRLAINSIRHQRTTVGEQSLRTLEGKLLNITGGAYD